MKVFYLFAALAILAGGCRRSLDFVIQRDVPSTPRVAIIPANNSLTQHEFANEVEAAVIRAGVQAIVRPALKDILTTATFETKGPGDVIESMERFQAVGDTDADYILETYAGANWVRLIRRASGEVLASFASSSALGAVDPVGIAKALAAAGLRVKPESLEL